MIHKSGKHLQEISLYRAYYRFQVDHSKNSYSEEFKTIAIELISYPTTNLASEQTHKIVNVIGKTLQGKQCCKGIFLDVL